LDFAKLKEKYEEQIRQAQVADVRAQIEKINRGDIPREQMADFSDIARRVRSENWGLRLLRPIVRSEVPVYPPPTSDELSNYAGLLIKVGAVSEAQSLLEQLDSEKNISVLTFLSQVHIAQWNYLKASHDLKKIIKRKEASPYQKCVAQVNLVGAYIFLEKYTEADNLLKKILQICQENNWDLLYGNALELSAQVAVSQKKWKEAEEFLNQAQKRLNQHSHYSLFIDKWKTLSDLFQTKPGSEKCQAYLKKIEVLSSKAAQLNSWETVRDLDYHVARFLKHQNLLLNIYFGTPYSQYKKRLEKICKENNWKIPDSYFRKVSSLPAERVLDLATGLESNRDLVEPLKPGKMLHRFLNILALDFYKPISLGEVFSNLFPDEYFNPDSSPERISQAVKQLRHWFFINEIPIDIQVQNGCYRLQATGAYAFKILKNAKSAKDLLDVSFEIRIRQLKIKWPYKSFSISHATNELKISATAVRQLLNEALKRKLLFKTGAGRSTVYRFEK